MAAPTGRAVGAGPPEGDLDDVGAFAALLAPHHGAGGFDRRLLHATVSVDADDPVDAARLGVAVVEAAAAGSGLTGWAVTAVEVITDAELAVRVVTAQPPAVGGAAEVAAAVGGRRRMAGLRRDKARWFPLPIATLACGPVWDMEAVQAWLNHPGPQRTGPAVEQPPGPGPADAAGRDADAAEVLSAAGEASPTGVEALPAARPVSDTEWASTLARIDALTDEAVAELLGQVEAAGHTFGPAMAPEAFSAMVGWLADVEQRRAPAEDPVAAAAVRHPAAGPGETPAGNGEPLRQGRTVEPPPRGPARRPGGPREVLPGPAVLGAGGRLILPGGKTVRLAGEVDVDQLASMALAANARVVMVHPSAPDPAGLAEAPEQRTQQTVRSAGSNVTVVLLGHDAERHCGPWADAATVEDLAAGLERFRRAVGHPWRSSVGRTGEAMMRFAHPAAKGGTQLGASPDLPKPAYDGSLELAFMWHRPLIGDERAAGWVHLYDLNAQYLAAWESVELGLGEPEYHPGPIDVEPWVRARPSGERLVAPPGLWRLEELPAEPVDEGLPNPWGNGRSEAHWVTTPTLARTFEVDPALIRVEEAWWWPEHSRYLRPVAEQLRDARISLLGDPAPAAELALAAVKDLYRRGTGRLAMADRARTSGWPRPDWRLTIIAQARVNLHRSLTAKLAAAPFAALVDGLCFATDEADPTMYAAGIGLPLGSKLGQFSYEGTAALTPAMLAALDAAGSAIAVVKLVKAGERWT